MEERKLAAMEATLRNLEARTDANHQTIGELRAASAQHETSIRVIGTELREARDDIAEIRRQLERDLAERHREREVIKQERQKERDEQKTENAATRKSLNVAIVTMLTLTVSVLGVLANLIA